MVHRKRSGEIPRQPQSSKESASGHIADLGRIAQDVTYKVRQIPQLLSCHTVSVFMTRDSISQLVSYFL